MDYFDILGVKYIDDVCNETHYEEIVLKVIRQTNFISLTPDMTARVEGAGTTKFSILHNGPLYDFDWELTPLEAGSIRRSGKNGGLVTWNALWNSFQTTPAQQAVVTAKIKKCNGTWVSYPQYIVVYPILDSDENRVRTYLAKQPIQNYLDVLAKIESPEIVNVKAGYFDGLGRNALNVQYFGATTAKDIVELKRYDEFGREAVKNLLFSINHTLSYRSQAIVEHVNFYNNPPAKVQADIKPYAETIFEPSPLNRVTEQGAPGAAWQPGTGKTIKKDYLVNLASEVFKFSYNLGTGSASLSSDVVTRFYGISEVYANQTKDEKDQSVLEYVDKEGRTICKKVQVSLGLADRVNQAHWASTYYLYDDLGNLVVVIPPEGVKAITGN